MYVFDHDSSDYEPKNQRKVKQHIKKGKAPPHCLFLVYYDKI
jgi:hypothetical protein